MKNIHILPTEDKLFKLSEYDEPNVDYAQNQNIYITSDEEIRKGDWCYHPLLKGGSIIQSKFDNPNSTMKKIILTTDQKLIKNGVQAIDDEFLEWFVKNPSCEFVDINLVEDLYGVIVKEENLTNREPAFFSYKIIIPKEEHENINKQEDAKLGIGGVSISALTEWLKSESVYTALRYAVKNPSNSGMDNCEDRSYLHLYNLVCQIHRN